MRPDELAFGPSTMSLWCGRRSHQGPGDRQGDIPDAVMEGAMTFISDFGWRISDLRQCAAVLHECLPVRKR